MDNLIKAQDRMKTFADRRRSERNFEAEDVVLLKLQPYKQTTVREAMPRKHSSKYFGPHTIIKKIGKVGYRLQLPPTTKIHNIFHVSQLKRYEGYCKR